jgi:hypothetical protein
MTTRKPAASSSSLAKEGKKKLYVQSFDFSGRTAQRTFSDLLGYENREEGTLGLELLKTKMIVESSMDTHHGPSPCLSAKLAGKKITNPSFFFGTENAGLCIQDSNSSEDCPRHWILSHLFWSTDGFHNILEAQEPQRTKVTVCTPSYGSIWHDKEDSQPLAYPLGGKENKKPYF